MSDQNALAVGDRVKVKDQQITGKIVWIDLEKSSYASILDDDRSDWMDSEEDDGTLEFRVSDLERAT